MNDLIFELDGDTGNELIFELGNAAIIAGDVTKAYVDQQDEATLDTAKRYTDDSIQNKIDKPEDTPAVGKVLKVKSVNEGGSFVCEWADGSGGISDVQVGGVSFVTDGVASVPLGTGLSILSNALYIVPASNNRINSRTNYYPLTAYQLDYAVKAAMCDGKGAAWTSAEQTAAQERMGIVTLTQEEYDLITVKGENTIYLIVG